MNGYAPTADPGLMPLPCNAGWLPTADDESCLSDLLRNGGGSPANISGTGNQPNNRVLPILAKPTEPRRFVVTIEAEPHPNPVMIRLRQCLKLMLRGYGFRCLSIAEAATTDRPATKPQKTTDDALKRPKRASVRMARKDDHSGEDR